MAKAKELVIDTSTMTITKKIKPGKVPVLILDGTKGKAILVEAVEHRMTSVETVKGQSVRTHCEEKELI